MDHELLNTKFDLPKSPAPTLHNDDSDDNDVEFVGTLAPPTGEWQWHTNQSLATVPPLLVTPPLSPLAMGVQHPNMPLLTTMLAQNSGAYPPQGYIVHIPCFLCQQPFNDIHRLREHLTMHAAQLSLHGHPPALDAPNACPFPPPAGLEVNGVHSRLTKDMSDPPAQGKARAEIHCDYCSKIFRSTMSLQAHLKQHRLPYDANDKWWTRKQSRCPICKKSYKRDSFLLKHMAYKHGEQLEPIRPECPPRPPRPAFPAPAPAPAPALAAERDQPKRCVYSTNLLNAVAAANYSPATESAAKYVPPTDSSQRQMDPSLKAPPKQKYALRSPYFNPNLWVDHDAYI